MRQLRWFRIVLLGLVLPSILLVSGAEIVSADDDDDGGIRETISDTWDGARDFVDGARDGASGAVDRVDIRDLPERLVNYVVDWVSEKGQDAFGSFLESSMEFAVSTPTMDNDGWMGVFGEPTDAQYEALYHEIYIGAVSPIVLFLMVLSIMVVATFLPFGPFINSYRASSWMLMIMGGIVAFALAWPIVSFMHLGADSIATWFAPSEDDLVNNLPQLSGGGLVGAGGLILFGWFKAAIFALLWGLRYTLLYMVMPFLFPFALSFALLGPHRMIRRMGSMIIWTYIGLLIMPIPAGLLFRGALAIDWGLSFDGMAGVVLTLATLFIAILLPFVILKSMFFTSAIMSSSGVTRGLYRRSRTRPSQRARHAGRRARDIVSTGAAAGRSRAVNLGERVGLVSNERNPSLDPRLHKRGPGTGSTQAERTSMVRQASREQASSQQIGQLGNQRSDVGAYQMRGPDPRPSQTRAPRTNRQAE